MSVLAGSLGSVCDSAQPDPGRRTHRLPGRVRIACGMAREPRLHRPLLCRQERQGKRDLFYERTNRISIISVLGEEVFRPGSGNSACRRCRGRAASGGTELRQQALTECKDLPPSILGSELIRVRSVSLSQRRLIFLFSTKLFIHPKVRAIYFH